MRDIGLQARLTVWTSVTDVSTGVGRAGDFCSHRHFMACRGLGDCCQALALGHGQSLLQGIVVAKQI